MTTQEMMVAVLVSVTTADLIVNEQVGMLFGLKCCDQLNSDCRLFFAVVDQSYS